MVGSPSYYSVEELRDSAFWPFRDPTSSRTIYMCKDVIRHNKDITVDCIFMSYQLDDFPEGGWREGRGLGFQ